MKAVLVGPFPLHEMRRLETEVVHYQKLKQAVQVQPDVVYVKKMMFLDFPSVARKGTLDAHVLGRTYAWIVYIPSLTIDDMHVLMTIDELKTMSRKDAGRHCPLHLTPHEPSPSHLRHEAVLRRVLPLDDWR
jgi:hypothetical protein